MDLAPELQPTDQIRFAYEGIVGNRAQHVT
jgi:hypothetical protein